MDPPACTKNQIPVAEKREDAGVTTMHGAQAKTYSGLTLVIKWYVVLPLAQLTCTAVNTKNITGVLFAFIIFASQPQRQQ